MTNRIQIPALQSKVMSAEAAAALIPAGATIGMSGFTGSGYPKAVPGALAARIEASIAAGNPFKVNVFTGASTAPELDGALAKVNGVNLRMPYQSDPDTRKRINSGDMNYIDMHLSHMAQFTSYGFLGEMKVAMVEVAAILEDGSLVATTSVGNNQAWLDNADMIILEVNSWQSMDMIGMHDIPASIPNPPNRQPLPLTSAGQRIGSKFMNCDLSKVVAIVETNAGDRNSAFSAPDEASKAIAQHILDFFAAEVKAGRLPPNLLPLQSGVGNIANAVLQGLNDGPFENLSSYTEVLQDGMLAMLKSGKLAFASATAFSLSPDGMKEFLDNIEFYRERIVLRPQDISNNPELIRRLGTLSMNGIIEADLYGNINSTHVMGSAIMNGIGGSGDFARNAFLTIFMTPSTAKGGAISSIVPMVSHVDHTEHDVMVVVTEQGLADLRGLSPRQRAEVIIEKCAHPDFKPALRDYYERALEKANGKHTPHILSEALSWHTRFLETGTMKA